MSERPELLLTAEDHDRAFTEVCFLLNIFVNAMGDVVGRSEAALGVAAGRHMGRKLPVHLVDATLATALEAVAARLAAGFAIEPRCNGTSAEIAIGRCAVRDVCARRKIDLGGSLCRIFHCYLAGMTTELLGGQAVKAGEATVGERCAFRLEAR